MILPSPTNNCEEKGRIAAIQSGLCFNEFQPNLDQPANAAGILLSASLQDLLFLTPETPAQCVHPGKRRQISEWLEAAPSGDAHPGSQNPSGKT